MLNGFTEQPRGNGELILVVDDESAVRQVAKATLEDHNYQVLLARDGIEAIALYTEHQPKIRVAIVDMTMPNLDGVTTLQNLKKIDSQVSMIAVSGLPANQQKALSAGAKLFLIKPYTAQELLMPLHHLILNANQSERSNPIS